MLHLRRSTKMTARELLAAYAEGHRNFSRVELSLEVGNDGVSRGLDLRGVDLSGADLSGADFLDVDLSKAELSRTNFRGATLHHCNLDGANLVGASFIDALLHNTYLQDANLADSFMDRATFSVLNGDGVPEACFLSRANLERARLISADLEDVDLRQANLTSVDARSASFRDANLSAAILDEADLSGACFIGANLRGASLKAAKMCGAKLQKVKITDAFMNGADIGGGHFRHADLSRSVLADVRAFGTDLRDTTLEGANLENVMFVAADLSRSRLAGANLRKAKLEQIVLLDLDLVPFCSEPTVTHGAPSSIDWRAVAKSYRHPRLKQFMIDCGMPALVAEYMIDCVRAIGEMNIRTMLQSTFISYGGPDEAFARKLHEALRVAQVRTFFFPANARVGERINREVYRGIQEHDRVLLVCSRASLNRVGVLHEIEETFAREARDGGATYLLPITLDEYVHGDWASAHPDLAQRINDRVVANFRDADTDDSKFQAAVARVIDALKVKPVPSSLPSAHGARGV